MYTNTLAFHMWSREMAAAHNVTSRPRIQNSTLVMAVPTMRRNILLCHRLLLVVYMVADCSPPPDHIQCSSGTTNCSVTNAYGVFPDRTTCRAGDVVYPTTEGELVAAVAEASRLKRKMKVVTQYGHSIPKLSCPGGDDGLLVSTRFLDRIVSVDASAMTMTVEGGASLKDVIEAAAEAGLALAYTPYWWGLSIAGLLSSGAHGSSLRDKGSAVHEYVIGLRIVTPASSREGYAITRSLDASHPQWAAAKVSLGVLGVISQVTLKLQPLFKRSITNSWSDDSDLADRAVRFGNEHEFAAISWYPSIARVVYVIDDRVPSDVPGDGYNDFIGFRPTPSLGLAANRIAEEATEAEGSAGGKCITSELFTSLISTLGYGLSNNGILFTGYPVVGYQNKLQSSGSCLNDIENALLTVCPWDPRVKGLLFHQSAVSIGLSKVNNFISDVQKLRDINPTAFCGLELYNGILMRYVKKSTAYLGKQEDSIDFDLTYYRSHDPMTPRLNEDIFEEIEQMALFKYGGLPHWGKNRNLAFDGVIRKYEKGGNFLKVKEEFDPDGLFSSEWTDQVLGLRGKTSIMREGCALEGLCVCSKDIHCSPDRGYFCWPGKVYEDARVCTKLSSP